MGSDEVSTQTPPQSVLFGSAHAHFPAMQESPFDVSHVLPQAPQFLLSVPVSLHVPPQVVRPSAHEHQPKLHIRSAAQRRPHLPQLSESFCRSTQMPSQYPKEDGHTHFPSRQVLPGPQSFPHDPQLFGSNAVSVIAPLQQYCGWSLHQLQSLPVHSSESQPGSDTTHTVMNNRFIGTPH